MSAQQQMNQILTELAVLRSEVAALRKDLGRPAPISVEPMAAAQRQRTHISDDERAARRAEVEALADLPEPGSIPIDPAKPTATLRLITQGESA